MKSLIFLTVYCDGVLSQEQFLTPLFTVFLKAEIDINKYHAGKNCLTGLLGTWIVDWKLSSSKHAGDKLIDNCAILYLAMEKWNWGQSAMALWSDVKETKP